jgi:hypothetical protein
VARSATAPDPQLADRLRAVVRRDLDAEIVRIAELPGQLGTRRFFRLELAAGAIASAIARVDRPEDPAGRPAGVPPEPPLEPIRSLLERSGCPVPRRFGGEADGAIELLEDVGDRSLRDAVADASESERQKLYREACDLVPMLQRVADPGNVEAFRRRLDDELFAYKADLFARWALPAEGRGSTGWLPGTRAPTGSSGARSSSVETARHGEPASSSPGWTPAG